MIPGAREKTPPFPYTHCPAILFRRQEITIYYKTKLKLIYHDTLHISGAADFRSHRHHFK